MEQQDELQTVLARLQQSLSSAPPGTIGFLRLTPGVYQGPIRLTFPITILGEPGAEIISDHDAVATVSLSKPEYLEGIASPGYKHSPLPSTPGGRGRRERRFDYRSGKRRFGESISTASRLPFQALFPDGRRPGGSRR
jgi:hypothetical protein